jgi:hypothetical protein
MVNQTPSFFPSLSIIKTYILKTQASEAPDPHNWTLRFKLHKTTVLLFVLESQSFTTIKSNLLAALKSTGVKEINGKTLPDSGEDIVFGVPVDKNNIEKGWVDLVITEPEDEERVVSLPKGVRKTVLNGSPLGAGLKDGAMLAFKFQNAGVADAEDDGWDVVMPRFDDDDDGSQV